MSYCTSCRQERPDTEFSRDASSPSGTQSRCRDCQKAARNEKRRDQEFRARVIENQLAEVAAVRWSALQRNLMRAPMAARMSAEKSLEESSTWGRELHRFFLQRATLLGTGECMCEVYDTDVYEDLMHTASGYEVREHHVWHQPPGGCIIHPRNYAEEFWLAPPWVHRPRRWTLIGVPRPTRAAGDRPTIQRGRLLGDLISARKYLAQPSFIVRLYG